VVSNLRLNIHDGGIEIKQIMVVDDEEDIRSILKTILEKEKYRVMTARNGHESLSLLKKETPDLIIMDIMMPDMDGWDTAKKIKKDIKTRGVPVIFLSVKGQSDPKVQARNYEAKGEVHIEKPFKAEKLINTIKNLIGTA